MLRVGSGGRRHQGDGMHLSCSVELPPPCESKACVPTSRCSCSRAPVHLSGAAFPSKSNTHPVSGWCFFTRPWKHGALPSATTRPIMTWEHASTAVAPTNPTVLQHPRLPLAFPPYERLTWACSAYRGGCRGVSRERPWGGSGRRPTEEIYRVSGGRGLASQAPRARGFSFTRPSKYKKRL